MPVYDYDCDFEFHRSCMRTAKKKHQCIECGALIIPGERYYYEVAGIPDGWVSVWQVKMCQRCKLDWEILESAYNGDGSVENVRSHYLLSELGTLRRSIWRAQEEGVLIDGIEQQMFLHWFLPGNIHPDQMWRLMELPFSLS